MNASSLTIKYQWSKGEEGIDLDVLGESIIGFNAVIKEIAKVLAIQNDIPVKTRIAKDGSIIFEIYTDVVAGVQKIPFNDLRAYLDFLSLIGKQTAIEGFALAAKAHSDLNALYAQYPLDAALLGLAIVKMISFAKKQKRTIELQDEAGTYLPKKYAFGLHRLIKKKRTFKRALRPFVDEQVTEIEIRTSKHLNCAATITTENFENYLSEDEQILPEYEDGKSYRFTGVIVSLESSRGDYMKFKAHGIKREHSLLVADPGDRGNTEAYIDFYKKHVWIEAKVIRKSLYQKPKLIIQKIDLMQKPLL